MKGKKKSTRKATAAVSTSTPLPPGWDESAGLRETYLYHFPKPEDVAALRHVLALLLELNLECPRLGSDVPQTFETPTRQELAAVTRDLRHSQGFLLQVARGPELSALTPVDEALARFAGKQAEELARIAEALERALA